MRRFFLITQFASSMALVVVAGTFVRTVVKAHVGEQSAAMDYLVVAGVEAVQPSGPGRAAYWQSVRTTLRRLPDVSAVTIAAPGLTGRSLLVVEGAVPSATPPSVEVQRVDQSFLPASGMPVITGRFEAALPQPGETEAVAVNERAARQFWGTTAVLDRRFALGGSAAVRASRRSCATTTRRLASIARCATTTWSARTWSFGGRSRPNGSSGPCARR